jgi:solute carrier family 40 (iron-regulated transporter), member 1
MKLTLASRVLTGRLLTRSGDQAWDFAVPLVLLHIFPGQIRFAALYYFVIRLGVALLLPRLGSIIDHVDRRVATKLGIVLQLFGVVFGTFSLWLLTSHPPGADAALTGTDWFYFSLLVFTGVISSLGASLMEIAIASDLIPSAFSSEELPVINSRIRQVDLLTEVGAPVAAGFILLIAPPQIPLLGFYLIALWNVLSFLPEYYLLTSIFSLRPDLNGKVAKGPAVKRENVFQRFLTGWRSFFKEPVALAVLAYAFLWLSVLSPHGVLLTGFLKDEWQMPEWVIGIYRALGAAFGLAATVLYPHAVRALGLVKGSRMFLRLQTILVIGALAAFLLGGRLGQIGFLGLILLSRVALYGFSLGEMQIRQEWINPNKRGNVNGFASALTGIATLGLYGAGSILPLTSDFKILIYLSVAAVVTGNFIFQFWARRNPHSPVHGVAIK